MKLHRRSSAFFFDSSNHLVVSGSRLFRDAALVDVLDSIQKQVAAYVWGLSNTPWDPGLAEAGKQIFSDNCAACHGEDAKGKAEMGAPDLADAIWLKARGEDAIIRQVASPKHGVMPAWAGRLGDTTVKELTIFVHSLGGGT
jgi:cytochrome c oxidase cbb3-type subunit 3